MEWKFYLMNIGGLYQVKDPTDSSTVEKTSTYVPAYTHIITHQKIKSEGFGGGGRKLKCEILLIKCWQWENIITEHCTNEDK